MIYSCKEVVKIISTGEKRSLVSKIKLSFHLFMCKNCQNYQKELEHIKKGYTNYISKKSEPEN